MNVKKNKDCYQRDWRARIFIGCEPNIELLIEQLHSLYCDMTEIHAKSVSYEVKV